MVKIKNLAKAKKDKLAKKNKQLKDAFTKFSLSLKKDELDNML